MTLVEFILNKFKDETSIDLSEDSQAMYRIKGAAEKALLELQSLKSTQIKLPFISEDHSGPKHLDMTIDHNWRKTDTDQLIFHKHRIHKTESKNQSLIFLTLAILIIVVAGLLIFFII